MKVAFRLAKSHFGDAVAACSWLSTASIDIYAQSPNPDRVKYFENIWNQLDSPIKVHFSHGYPKNCVSYHLDKENITKHKYVSTKLKYNNNNLITYSWDANFAADIKVPSWLPNSNIANYFDAKYLGEHLGLIPTIELLAQSKLFICCESGLAHLARCVGVPTLIIEYKHFHSVELAHPRNMWQYESIKPNNEEELSSKIKELI